MTCERCPIADCEVRLCEATELQKTAANDIIAQAVNKIMSDYS